MLARVLSQEGLSVREMTDNSEIIDIPADMAQDMSLEHSETESVELHNLHIWKPQIRSEFYISDLF